MLIFLERRDLNLNRSEDMTASELEKYFTEGVSLDDLEMSLGTMKALHDLHYKKFSLSEKDVEKIRSIGHVKIIIITEPWCGDSLAIVPVIKKISELSGSWEIKVLFRDENSELIDKFLTNGGRAIPKLLFLDSDFNLIFHWGPRPKKVQEIYEKYRYSLKKGEVEKPDVVKEMRRFYAKDRGAEIFKEIYKNLKKNK